MIEDRTSEQIAFYDRGLGTGWRKVTGSVGGRGISKNIQECYRFIFENYSADDPIYLFGFSHGATTVRSLSGFIHLFGILPKSRPELIKQAYKIYKIKERSKREKKASEFVAKHHTMWCPIKCLGCWDTVAALGSRLRRWMSSLIGYLSFVTGFMIYALAKVSRTLIMPLRSTMNACQPTGI